MKMKKKILALLMTVVLLLSVCTVIASAEISDVSWNSGNYAAGSADDFSPVGTVKIQWDPDASKKLDLTDGDMADWSAAGYKMTTIGPQNMISWVGGTENAVDEGMPEGWGISAYFVADSKWLYVGFYITDPNFVYGTADGYHYGDAIQLGIDFGGKMQETFETNPDLMYASKDVFYSFGCVEDGAPLQIMRQESDNDGWLMEEKGDAWQGTARKTENGWSVELALSIKMLYKDYVWKTWDGNPKIYLNDEENSPLKINCALYYLNKESADSGFTWAAGTGSGYVLNDGHPGVSWTVYDNGIQLELDYVDGMYFDCDDIIIYIDDPVADTVVADGTLPTPDIVTPVPDEGIEAPVSAGETAAPAPAATSSETDTQGVDVNCTTVLSSSSLLILAGVLAACAACTAIRKREE